MRIKMKTMIMTTMIMTAMIMKAMTIKIRMMLRLLTASIAEVVSIAVSPPERGRGRPTVHTLSTLCKKDKSQIFLHCGGSL